MTPGDIDEVELERWERLANGWNDGTVSLVLALPILTQVPRLIAALHATTLRAEAAERVVTPITETAERLERELLAAETALRDRERELIDSMHRHMSDLGDGIAQAIGYAGMKDGDALTQAVANVVAERDAARAVVAELLDALEKQRTREGKPVGYSLAVNDARARAAALRDGKGEG